MQITNEEQDKFRSFTREAATKAGLFDFDPNMTIWHYTNGAGFLGIIESGAIRATHVAALNDSTETLYATRLFREFIVKLKASTVADDLAQTLLHKVLNATAEGDNIPGHADSKYFVSCFTSLEDDAGQWLKYSRADGNGYAISFKAAGLRLNGDTAVIRVNYDQKIHLEIAEKAAKLTLDYFLEGLTEERSRDIEKWCDLFFEAWDQNIYRLAPVVKATNFRSEEEFRLVHELQSYGLPFVRFQQKDTLLARYIDLKPYGWQGTRTPVLPITKICVGPGHHRGISKKSAEALLRQMGYADVPVSVSTCPLQKP